MMEAEKLIGVGKVVQALPLLQNTVTGGAIEKHAQVDVPGKGGKLGVEFKNAIHMRVAPFVFSRWESRSFFLVGRK